MGRRLSRFVSHGHRGWTLLNSNCIITHRLPLPASIYCPSFFSYESIVRRYGSARPQTNLLDNAVSANDCDNDITQYIRDEVFLVSTRRTDVCSCSTCRKRTLQIRENAEEKPASFTDNTVHLFDGNEKTDPKSSNSSLLSSADKHAATEPTKKPGLLKRFQQMYKQYGIVMVCVHWSIAPLWAGAFYYAAIRSVIVCCFNTFLVPVLRGRMCSTLGLAWSLWNN